MEGFGGNEAPKSRKPMASNVFHDMPSFHDFDTLLATVRIIPGMPSEENHPTKSYGMSHVGDSTPLSSTKTIIYGINSDPGFFTSAQIFQTTTGLRAVSPSAALRLDPDLGTDVGQLLPGHVLRRLSDDNKSYDEVPVLEISSQETSEALRSVRLPKGERTFHANGYLAQAIQPNLEVVKAADATARLEPHQRLKALKALPEAAPFFHAIGDGGVGTVLEKELLKGQFRLTNKRHSEANPWKIPLNRIRRTWALYYTDDQKVMTPKGPHDLPRISVFEGVLHIHGSPILTAEINCSTGIISWVRPLDGGHFEHGYLRIFEHGMAGDGIILLSPHQEAEDLEQDEGLSRATVRAVKWEPPRSQKNISIRSNPSFSASSQTGITATTQQNMSSMSMVANSDPGDGTDDSYAMMIDLEPWAKDKSPPDKFSRPSSFCSLQLSTQNIGGVDGLNLPIINVPILDALLEAINESADGTEVDELYNSTLNLTGRSKPTGSVTFVNVPLIADLADSYSPDSPFNLTFQQALGSDIVLPMLFSELHVELTEQGLAGAAFAFDPDMRGCKGQRYRINSALNLGTASETVKTRLALSGLGTATAAGSPALASSEKVQLDRYSVEDLLHLADYNEGKLHSKTQDLIRSMMLYHLKPEDRIGILGVNERPKDLPNPLADGLDPSLRNWLKAVYGPAVVCQTITQASVAAKSSWRHRFSAEEEAKVWYFFTGKGPQCLSRSKEYNQITQLAFENSMRILYTRLQVYLNMGGRYWARRTLACITHPAVLQSLQRTPVEGGVNYSNKYINILNYLDRSGTYAKDFYDAVYDDAISEALSKPYIDNSSEGAQRSAEVVEEIFKNLATAVINDLDEYELLPEVRANLLADIQKAEADLGLSGDGTAEERVQVILDKNPTLFTLLGKSMSSQDLGEVNVKASAVARPRMAALTSNSSTMSVKAAPKTGKQSSFGDKGKTGYAWAQAKFKAVNNFMGTVSAMTALSGIMTIAMVGYLVNSASLAFTAWDMSNNLQRSNLINGSLSTAVYGVGYSLDTWFEWKKAANQWSVLSRWRTKNVLVARKVDPTALKTLTSKMVNKSMKIVDPVTDAMEKSLEIFDELVQPQKVTGEAVLAKLKSTYNMGSRIVAGVAILLCVALVVTMSLDLKDQWSNLNAWGQATSIINITITALSIVFNPLAAQFIVWVGSFAAATASAINFALPMVGTVLAIIGIIIAILCMVFQTSKPPPPPPLTPVEAFIIGPGRDLIGKWQKQPDPKLTYTITPSTLQSNRGTVLTVTGENRFPRSVGSGVRLRSITFTFLAGPAEGSMFSNLDFKIVNRSAIRKNETGNIYVSRGDGVVASLTTESRDGGKSVSVSVVLKADATEDEENDMKIVYGALLSLTISGVARAGSGYAVLDIVEDSVSDDDQSGIFPVVQII